ncbi:MAG: 2-oxoacid:acceptor oxidoreductase subunit alpha [Desulfobacterales bacterium]|nr:MAG: 2-oxoacid:acceptor oxidoreductase subunit alpha [Desulfobacterales bacterium]
MAVDISIRITGQAGQGIQSISSIMGKVFTRQGYYVFIIQDAESRIRGGHNFDQVRIKDKPVLAIHAQANYLICLDGKTVEQDLPVLTPNGVMIYDGSQTRFESDNPNHFSIPLEQIALEAGQKKIMVNAVATGAAFALMGFDLRPLLDRLAEEFAGKGQEIAAHNQSSASAGYRYVRENFRGRAADQIPPGVFAKQKLLINGSQAMALGAICAGLKFYSGYPMSPSTPIMEFVAAAAQDHHIICEPAEDEIAAVNMVIGAGFAGVRAMTATSGGGFCLMTEALGLAGMTETPLVIVVAQRPGPSTGLPTRTEQGDLRFAMHAAHGEFPRAVLAPGHAAQAFYLMARAFNLAERYQTPVIVLGDQHLNDSYCTVDELDLNRMTIDRGKVVFDDQIASVKDYKRYVWQESGISPRILPGLSEAVVYADSDEHTDAGHITESSEVRNQMVRKRMRKLAGMRQEMGSPEIYPSQRAALVLLGWGSLYGAMKEAVELLQQDGIPAQMCHFSQIYPFTAQAFHRKILKKSRILAVENNYSGQFADFFTQETGRAVCHKILKYDGRPFAPREIVDQVKEKM